MTIYYFVPNHGKPSWGIGIIYYHVQILTSNGFRAVLLHEDTKTGLDWLELSPPSTTMTKVGPGKLREDDILVVPEVCMDRPWLKKVRCRKILFIQAPGYIYESLPLNETHRSLGFSEAFIIMPHQVPIVDNHIHLQAHLIPPFVSDIFFRCPVAKPRKKQIVLYPKYQQIDYTIVRKLIHDRIKSSNGILPLSWFQEWKMIELKGMSHKQVARTLCESSIFVSLNTFEALNTSVVEAMASGCLIFCYEGFGPRDYLENEKNAFVFGNNEAYMLCEKLFELMDHYEESAERLEQMRRQARQTAKGYSLENMETALLNVAKKLSSSG